MQVRSRSQLKRISTKELVVGSFFLLGAAFSLWGHPASTYSWMWQEARDTGHEFAIGLLDIGESSFDSEWTVIEGGNQRVDLSRMIPGDARQLKATLSNGDSDLDFMYKIVAQVKDTNQPGAARRLEEVLHIRIETEEGLLYEGLVRDLHRQQPGLLQGLAGLVPDEEEEGSDRSRETEGMFFADEDDKTFWITVYLPTEGVDHSYQSLKGELELRFLAKQATPGAIYAE